VLLRRRGTFQSNLGNPNDPIALKASDMNTLGSKTEPSKLRQSAAKNANCFAGWNGQFLHIVRRSSGSSPAVKRFMPSVLKSDCHDGLIGSSILYNGTHIKAPWVWVNIRHRKCKSPFNIIGGRYVSDLQVARDGRRASDQENMDDDGVRRSHQIMPNGLGHLPTPLAEHSKGALLDRGRSQCRVVFQPSRTFSTTVFAIRTAGG